MSDSFVSPPVRAYCLFTDDDAMPEESTNTNQTTTGNESTSTTSSADGQQAADSTTGAGTQTAQTTEAQTQTTETKTDATTKIDTNSPEFKAALTAAIRDKLPQLQKQARKDVAKELSGEKEGEPTVEELKSKMSTLTTENMQLKARDQLEEFVTDKRNQVQVKNVRGLYKFIKGDLQFDDEGKVTNFKEVIAQAKSEASEFFGGSSTSIDAGNGSRQFATADMNALIRGR